MDMLKFNIFVTILFLVPTIGFAISFYFFVRSQKYLSVVTGVFSFLISFLVFLSIEFFLHDNRLTQDIHQGDVFSLPSISQENKKHIHGTYFNFFVNQIDDSSECHRKWFVGQSLSYVFDGSPLSMTVLGLATKPDYTYLLSLDSGFDFPCIKSVLVTTIQLAVLKTEWKREWTIIRMPVKNDSAEMELRSVQPLKAAGPQNILAHSTH